MLHSYNSKELSTCISTSSSSKRIVFIGDSTTRTTFYALAKIANPNAVFSKDKHSDQIIEGPNGLSIHLYWDPFLNGTATQTFLTPDVAQGQSDDDDGANQTPALLVFGTGLWHLRYLPTQERTKVYVETLDRIWNAASTGGEHLRIGESTAGERLADEVVVLPVQRVVEEHLTSERAATINNTAIQSLNRLLRSREQRRTSSAHDAGLTFIEVPWSFNEMLGDGASEVALGGDSSDGLHLSDAFTKQQANILLNMRCNDLMPKKFPRKPEPSSSMLNLFDESTMYS